MSTATQVLQACAAACVREFCICAGARNVELVVALERSTGCRVWHFFDERSAAFFALGRMMKTGEAVAVITTSGTAVAELLPATVEAYYQSLPLVLITADRPVSFRGTGAPQAIEQVGIFSDYAVCLDFQGGDEIQLGEGPLHLNVCFEEPEADLIEELEGVEFSIVAGGSGDVENDPRLQEFLSSCDAGLLVMLGNLPADERVGLLEFLQKLGAPVLAEAGSGLREKLPELIVREVPDGIRAVLRIGGVPSDRFWRDLEGLNEIPVLSVDRGRRPGLARECEVIGLVDWAGFGEVQRLGGNRGNQRPMLLSGEPQWFRFLSENIPSNAVVMIGNSLPIREWNTAATFEDRGLQCFSSRGANGIDGQLSTFFGLSEDEAESWVIVGDLTAMYDLSAPWILRELAAGKRRIVVVNNGGGKIFSKLRALKGLGDSERRAIENDHGVSLEHWAAMWGMSYLRVQREDEFVIADEAATMVIEIFVGRASE